MFQKTAVVAFLMLGLMLPACGGDDGPSGLCNSLITHLLSVCDQPGDDVLIEQFLASVGEDELTVEEVRADDGATAIQTCTESFSDGDFDQAQADQFVASLEATDSCAAALAVAAQLQQ